MSKNFLNSKWKWDKDTFIEDALKMVINRKFLEKNIKPKQYFVLEDENKIDEEYKKIFHQISQNFKLNEREKGYEEKFLNGVLPAKIIFYTQYFAGAPSLDIARFISYTNITNFISAHFSKDICGHKFGIGLMERLQYLFRFYVYEKDVYLNCIAKVALASLRDHKHDIEEDIKKNHQEHNPFLTGEINNEMYDEFEKGLIDIIESNI